MTIIQALILGLVQGATEYLPVSSSAHLVLVPKLLGWTFPEQEAFIFDVLVQLGTLVGVLVYFYNDLKNICFYFLKGLLSGNPLKNHWSRLGIYIIVATIPATVIGLLFKDFFQSFFSSPKYSCIFLIVTAILLFLAEKLQRGWRNEVLFSDAVVMGFAQACAIFPGLSRSGTTISLGMIKGLSRSEAARFSFLMSIPVMLGAGILATDDLISDYSRLSHMLLPLMVGFITSAITGYIVIKWFLDYLKNRSLYIFSAYCLALGLIGLFVW